MEERRQALVVCGLVCLTLALVSYLGVLGGGWWFAFAGKTFSTAGAVFVGLSFLVDLFVWARRPWRSGRMEYQRLKVTTYKQLKEKPRDRIKIAQSFFMDAEKLGVLSNTYRKDFDLIWQEVDRESEVS